MPGEIQTATLALSVVLLSLVWIWFHDTAIAPEQRPKLRTEWSCGGFHCRIDRPLRPKTAHTQEATLHHVFLHVNRSSKFLLAAATKGSIRLTRNKTHKSETGPIRRTALQQPPPNDVNCVLARLRSAKLPLLKIHLLCIIFFI